MPQDRRHQGRRLRALELTEERTLGGRLAGMLYLTGAVTVSAMLLVPGVETRHWRIVLTLAAVGLAWTLACSVGAALYPVDAADVFAPGTAAVA